MQGDGESAVGLDRQIAQAFDLGPLRQGDLYDDFYGLVARLLLDVPDGRTTQGHGQVAIDGVDGDAAAHRLLGVHVEAPVVVGLAQVVVHVAGALGLGEEFGHVTGELAADLRRRPVDLRHHRLQHRRPRRHLDDGDGGAGPLDQLLQHLPGRDRQLVAAPLALVFVQELNL